jgi:hypothetical protein
MLGPCVVVMAIAAKNSAKNDDNGDAAWYVSHYPYASFVLGDVARYVSHPPHPSFVLVSCVGIYMMARGG